MWPFEAAEALPYQTCLDPELQIPSNLLLKHTRANVYLATIILLWGMCACAFAGMRTPGQFYAHRLLLGIFEAGAFPGMWYFLSRCG